MKHSDIHAGSGTVASVQDPSTGMYLDLSFAPGQTHRTLHVMLNGELRTAYARLIKIETDGPDDLVLSLRVPGAPSDAPPVNKNKKPHPATVLRPEEETRAGREAVRSEGPKTPKAKTENAPHPATVQSPEDVTRAANEALRVNRPPQNEVARIQKEQEDAIQAMEPVMSAEELGALYSDAKTMRENRARMQGSDAPGLQTLVASDVDLATLNDFPMTDAEITTLHDDAKTLRSREEPATDSPHELVEGDAKKKDGKKTKVSLR